MLKSSSGSAFGFRSAALVFAGATVFFAWLFVVKLVSDNEIRSGVFTYGLVTGITAIGLWMRRGWGRSVALIIALSSAGLGVLSLFAVLLTRDGSPVTPAVVLVASAGVAYWMSRL